MLKVYPACISIKTGIRNIDWFCCRILGHLLWSGEIGRTDYARNLAKYLRFIKPLSKPDLRFPLKNSYYLLNFIFIQIYLTSFHSHAFLDFTQPSQSQKMLNVNIFDIWTVDVLISGDLSSVSGQHHNPSLSPVLSGTQNTNFVLKIFQSGLTVTW